MRTSARSSARKSARKSARRALKRKATPSQVALVREVIERHQKAVLGLSLEQSQSMLDILQKAKLELQAQLKRWIEVAPDGELRWTAHSYRNAIIQLHHSTKAMTNDLLQTLDSSTDEAQKLAIAHFTEQVAVLSEVFEGSVTRIPLNVSKLIATGRSYIIPRIHSSAARYAGQVGKDLQQRLAIDILKGAPVHETIKRLQESGGPRGLVSLQGIAGEKGAITELIPEGLFARYRYFASRIVRTETSSAYAAQSADARHDAGKIVPDLLKKWVADGAACPQVCAPMDGQVVAEHENFQSPDGPIEGTPAHPNCGCTEIPWKADWPEILGDLIN